MRHLFSSVVRVERLQKKVVNGRPITEWSVARDSDPAVDHQFSWLECRLDLNFLRPGKDAPAPVNAGVSPDRVGIMFTLPAPLRAGDRLVAIPDEHGRIVVPGTFEIKAMPDYALDYATQHHIEVQIVEVTQDLSEGWVMNQND